MSWSFLVWYYPILLPVISMGVGWEWGWDGECICLLWLPLKKYHKLDSLTSKDLSSHSSGGCKSKIKVSEKLVPSEGCGGESVPCFSMLASGGFLALFSIPLHVEASSNLYLHLNVASPHMCVEVQIAPFCKDHSQ